MNTMTNAKLHRRPPTKTAGSAMPEDQVVCIFGRYSSRMQHRAVDRLASWLEYLNGDPEIEVESIALERIDGGRQSTITIRCPLTHSFDLGTGVAPGIREEISHEARADAEPFRGTATYHLFVELESPRSALTALNVFRNQGGVIQTLFGESFDNAEGIHVFGLHLCGDAPENASDRRELEDVLIEFSVRRLLHIRGARSWECRDQRDLHVSDGFDYD